MKIVWSRTAQIDAHRNWMFIAQHSVSRADRVEVRLQERSSTLGFLALQGRQIAQGLRELSIPDVQLVVRYCIMEDEDTVRILGVRHTRQRTQL